MDAKYFMDELWPLLSDEEKQTLFDLASLLAMYAPQGSDERTDGASGGE